MIVLSERESAVLELLARGHTDASAASRLRLSQRTIATVVRGLMSRFNVSSRFQLGLALGLAHRRVTEERRPERAGPGC